LRALVVMVVGIYMKIPTNNMCIMWICVLVCRSLGHSWWCHTGNFRYLCTLVNCIVGIFVERIVCMFVFL